MAGRNSGRGCCWRVVLWNNDLCAALLISPGDRFVMEEDADAARGRRADEVVYEVCKNLRRVRIWLNKRAHRMVPRCSEEGSRR